MTQNPPQPDPAASRRPNQPATVVIDFSGMAGSGKSHVAEQLLQRLGPGAVRMDHYMQLPLRYPLRARLHAIARLPQILAVAFSFRPQELSQALKYAKKMYQYHYRTRAADLGGARYIICDEGMLHRLRGVRRNALERCELAALPPRLVRALFLRAALNVVLDTPQAVREERKIRRDGLLTRLHNRPTLAADPRTSTGAIIDDARHLQQNFGIPMLVIANRDEPSLQTELDQILASLPRGPDTSADAGCTGVL